MPDSIRAAKQMELYRRYLDMADRTGGELREAYLCMARTALRCAEEFDTAAVDHASASAVANGRQDSL